MSPDLKEMYKTSSLPYDAICLYFCSGTSLTGQLSSLSFLQHVFQVCSSPCKASFCSKCLQKLPKPNLSMSDSLAAYVAIYFVSTGPRPTYLSSPTLTHLLYSECPHPNSVSFHISSFTYVSINQDPVPSHPCCCKSSAYPPLLILPGILSQQYKHRLQGACVRQQQPQWQLRALAALFCQQMEVTVSRIPKSPSTKSWRRLWLPFPIQASHTTLE